MIHFSHVDSPFYYNLISFYWNLSTAKSSTANQHIFQQNPRFQKYYIFITDRGKTNQEWWMAFWLWTLTYVWFFTKHFIFIKIFFACFLFLMFLATSTFFGTLKCHIFFITSPTIQNQTIWIKQQHQQQHHWQSFNQFSFSIFLNNKTTQIHPELNAFKVV